MPEEQLCFCSWPFSCWHLNTPDLLRGHEPFDSFLQWDESIFLSLELGEGDQRREQGAEW